MVLLRDGRTLIGYLRSVDQFANLVLHKTIERIHVGTEYGDIPRGIFIIRGENVVLLGEIVSVILFLFVFAQYFHLNPQTRHRHRICYLSKTKNQICRDFIRYHPSNLLSLILYVCLTLGAFPGCCLQFQKAAAGIGFVQSRVT